MSPNRESRMHVRVYYSVRSDPKFVGIYSDDHHLATWLRLLLDADAVWPEPASLPRVASTKSVRALEAAELIELDGQLFRVQGLDAERAKRSSVGIAGASARWSRRNADAMPTHSERSAVPMLAEQSKADLSNRSSIDISIPRGREATELRRFRSRLTPLQQEIAAANTEAEKKVDAEYYQQHPELKPAK